MNFKNDEEFQAWQLHQKERMEKLFDTYTYKGKLADRKRILIDLYKSNESQIIMHKNSDGFGQWQNAQAYEKENDMIVEWLGEIQTQIDEGNKG